MSARVREASIGVGLMAGTVAYLFHWPHDFYGFDEGLYLYEAKRVLAGEVMYRDFFEILTPAWFYLMAALYAVFGVSIETARVGMAVVHAAIVGLIYLACRSTRVSPSIAVLAALTHLTLGYPACTIATPHWFSTFVMMVQLLIIVRWPGVTARRALLWGALSGALILVQQQKGVVMAFGVGLVLLLDQIAEPRRAFLSSSLRHLTVYAAGILLVTVPVMLAFVVTAGFDNVFLALVQYPLVNYRRIHEAIPWGAYLPRIVPFGFIVKYLPLVLPLALIIILRNQRIRAGGQPIRSLIITFIVAAAALVSVIYHPNHLHFAYVAPVWFTLAAQLLERLVQSAEVARYEMRKVAGSVAFALVLGCGWQLRDNLQVRQHIFKVPAETAFGRIDFADDDAVRLFRWLNDLLRDEQVSEIFVYPADAGIYLLTGTRNPTRFQIVLPYYTDLDQIEEIIASLAAHRVPIVIRELYWGVGLLQPLNAYVEGEYRRVMPPSTWTARIYRRHADVEDKTPLVF